jgi:hypothetical protein
MGQLPSAPASASLACSGGPAMFLPAASNGIQGYKMNGTTYKVHLDGYNNLDLWTGKTGKSAWL